jgi:hypothetical protein
MLKVISAVIAAAAFAGGLTFWTTSMWLDARPTLDAAPQSTPVTETAPALAAAAISPELVRPEVARDLAVMRNSIEQLAAKQEQMAQNIATLQATEQDIIQHIATLQAAEQTGPVSPPPRKKTRRVAPRKLDAQASSGSPPAFAPQWRLHQASFVVTAIMLRLWLAVSGIWMILVMAITSYGSAAPVSFNFHRGPLSVTESGHVLYSDKGEEARTDDGVPAPARTFCIG